MSMSHSGTPNRLIDISLPIVYSTVSYAFDTSCWRLWSGPLFRYASWVTPVNIFRGPSVALPLWKAYWLPCIAPISCHFAPNRRKRAPIAAFRMTSIIHRGLCSLILVESWTFGIGMRVDDLQASGNTPCLIAKFVHLLIRSDSHSRGLSFTSPFPFRILCCMIFIIVVEIPLQPGVVPALFLDQISFHCSQVCASFWFSVSAVRFCTSTPPTHLHRAALTTFQQRIGISRMPSFSISDNVVRFVRLSRQASCDPSTSRSSNAPAAIFFLRISPSLFFQICLSMNHLHLPFPNHLLKLSARASFTCSGSSTVHAGLTDSMPSALT